MARQSFDPYRVLGLPIGANQREIRRRYRQLARKLHPDVRLESEKAHDQFIELRRAYEMLMDDTMRARFEEQLLEAPAEDITVVDDFDAELAQAQDLVERGYYVEAKGQCADLLRARPAEPRIFDLLARVYDIEGNDLLQKRMEQEAERLRAPAERPPAARVSHVGYRDIYQAEPIRKRPLVLVTGALAVAGCVLAVRLASGEPVISEFSLTEIAAGIAAALIGAFCAVAGGLLGSFDEEVGGMVSDSRGVTAPMWLYLMTAGVVSVGLALIFYLIFTLLESGFSRDVLGFFAGVIALTFAMAWAHAGALVLVLLFGANLVFLSALIGWALGSPLRPGQWWQ